MTRLLQPGEAVETRMLSVLVPSYWLPLIAAIGDGYYSWGVRRLLAEGLGLPEVQDANGTQRNGLVVLE